MNGLSNTSRSDLINAGRRSIPGPGLRGRPPRDGFEICDSCWGFGYLNDVVTLLMLPPLCDDCGGIGEIPIRSFPPIDR